VPLSGRYLPKAGDQVVGTVTDVQSTFWLLDIGAPRWAPLHMTGAPWKVDVGETERFLRAGDAVVVRVENLDATGRIGVTMLGDGLGKLEGGTIVRISPARVPRLVGRGGSMIATITRHTSAEVAIGQNGRVWIGGSPEAIQRVREVLRMIEENGPRSGLTDRVERFLLATTPTRGGPEDSGIRVVPHDEGPPAEAAEPSGAAEDESGDASPDDE
jgi:exosome complex component RRP4